MDVNSAPYQQHLPHLPRLSQHTSNPQSSSSNSASTSKPVFEFTKRKKWDDLLLSEIHLTIIFILSLSSQQSASKILFTGYNSALSDVLGYSDTELLDSSFSNIMNERDGQVWQSIVDDAVRAHNTGTIGMFVRLKRKPLPPPQPVQNQIIQQTNGWSQSPTSITPPSPLPDVLFEIRGHVQYTDPLPSSQPEPLCVLASATPYPSSVSNALNSFLEQKIEHERLLKRVRMLQARSNTRAIVQHQDTNSMIDSIQNFTFPHQTHQTQQLFSMGFPLTIPSSISLSDPRTSIPSASSERGMVFPQSGSVLSPLEDDEESRRKKSKKAPQYVCITCGRTDSPEWRKGPQGPKTLCNACGLRWAKKARKLEGSNEQTKLGS